jgi:hypothetical protein
LGVLPLAPLCQLPPGVPEKEGLAGVVDHVDNRCRRDAPRDEEQKLMTAAFVLIGLRVDREVALELFKGVRAMRESSTYQYILDEGRTEAAQRILLRLGRKRFGEPDESTRTVLKGITDPDRLEALTERLLDVTSWKELLEIP